MSKEFETLDQPLMVEIIRRRQIPKVQTLIEPHFDANGISFRRSFYIILLTLKCYRLATFDPKRFFY